MTEIGAKNYENTSYHPISEKEMNEWYFNLNFDRIAGGDTEQIEALAKRYGLDKEHCSKFLKTIQSAVKEENHNNELDATHGFYIAVVQGFFRNYHYCNGRSFSTLVNQNIELKTYTKSWDQLSDSTNPDYEATHKHSAGTYITAEGVAMLLIELEKQSEIAKLLADFYKDYLTIFVNALEIANKGNCGLLEAYNVAEINVDDLNNSVWHSNQQNCDVEGLRVYQLLNRREKSECKLT